MNFRRNLITIVVAGAFFVSLLYSRQSFNQHVAAKNFGFELLCSLTAGAAIVQLFFAKYRLVFTVTFIDILLVLLSALYSVFLIACRNIAYDDFLPYYYLIFYFSVCFLIRNNIVLQSEILRTTFFVAVVVIFAHLAIVSVQYWEFFPALNNQFKTGSTFGNPDALGSYIVLIIPFCFYSLQKYKPIAAVAILLAISLLIFIQARTSLVAIIIAGLFWFLSRYKISPAKIAILGVSLVVLIALLVSWHPQSVSGRVFLWLISLKMIKDNPMGSGLNAFNKENLLSQADFLSKHPQVLKFISPAITHSPFNEFLHTGAVLGILGLLLLLIICVYAISLCLMKKELPFSYSVVIFIVLGCSYFPFSHASHICILAICLAMLTLEERVLYQHSFGRRGKIPVAISAALTVFLTWPAITNYFYYNKWTTAILLMSEGNLKDSEISFSQCYRYRSNDPRFLMTYAALKLYSGKRQAAIKYLEQASEIFLEESLLLQLGSLYEETRQNDKALAMYQLDSKILPDRFYGAYYKILLLKKIHRDEAAFREAVQLFNKKNPANHLDDVLIIKKDLKQLIEHYNNQAHSSTLNVKPR